ncbi:ribosomal-protein-alanine N-acetyltransferase [Mucilaginibacter mallensis]|uniref:Ribosomal-protein-alanine N-acetyltransferase n=1 Tax=Mucilaginibacter mallensis TaxID=652787 RepID=A0A1H2B6S2_MUCMA|nr:GNAT family N-acetyltransferase [Mucilaginibacter mallensis]SDT53874.1 ribosomal-protein-alanine N-acetyltransferase [Mucilaginibacter mallensis]
MNTNFTPFPDLQTNRLLLRRLTSDDCVQLQQLRSDENVNRYLKRPKSVTIDECEAFVKKIDGNLNDGIGAYWVIAPKTDNTLIGTVCLWNFNLENETVDLGYELSPTYQGQGLMLEVVEKIIAFAFNTMQAKTIFALTRPDNEGSRNLLKRSNFQQDVDYQYVSEEDAEGDVVYFLKN